MKFDNDNNSLTLYLSGRIDANNTAEVEAEIYDVLAKNPGLVPAFDASELEYISSAGLRVLLKFRKQFGKNLDVINASESVYDIFEVTGFTELLNVKKRLREISIAGCKEIGRGHYSTVYRLNGDTIVKVFNRAPITLDKIEHDQKTAREIFIRDIPTAISFDVVRTDSGHYGIVYEMIDAVSVSEVINQHPERISELGRKAGALLRKLHTTEFPAGTLPYAVENWREAVKKLHAHEYLSDSEADMLTGMIDSIPHRNTLVHYDYHPSNILVQGDDLVLIDVGGASLGNPIVDFACLYFLCVVTLEMMHIPQETITSIIGLDVASIDRWRNEMLCEYFNTNDPAKLKEYNAKIEGYAVLRILPTAADRINDNRPINYAEMLTRTVIDYLKKNGLKSLEGMII